MQDKHVSPAYDLDSVDWPNANWRFWPASAWFADSVTFKSPVNQIAAWKRQRNLGRPAVKWHLTTAQARHKLKWLYADPA